MSVHPTRAPTIYRVTIDRELFGRRYKRCIGVAFPHEDGEGFNIFLDALPLQGELTLELVSVTYGAGDGRDLLPVNWPPENVGTTFDPWPHGKGKKKTPRRR